MRGTRRQVDVTTGESVSQCRHYLDNMVLFQYKF